MSSLRPALPLLLGLASACGISEDRFATKAAQEWCEFYSECGTLESYGDTVDACEAVVEELTKDYLSAPDCEYDGGLARQCLRDISEQSCDAGEDSQGDVACDDVCGDTTAGETE